MNNNKIKEIKVSNDTIDISIVGAGLGGLSLAISLIKKGFTKVKVYERDVYFNDRKQGYGLTLTNNNKGPLAYLGVLEECIKKNSESDCHWIFKSNGEIMGYYGRHFIKQNKEDNNTNDRGNLRISRQNLRQMLLNKLPENTVIWGKKLIDYNEFNNNIEMIIEDSNLNKEIINTNILIGADGIRSIVRRLRDIKICEEDKLLCSPLKYIGISVTIGLTTAMHPLINQRGFYILDGTHRLFTMPFREESIDANNNIIPQLTMWQLSYSGLTEQEAELLRTKTSSELISDALFRTNGWLHPVFNMINETPLTEVWATGLYDRNPMHVYSKQRQGKGNSSMSRTNSLVTFIGDACHPMSMFKGQGANQALEDGPHLASWLSSPSNSILISSLPSKLRCFEREMVSRSGNKIIASRNAANLYHSLDVFNEKYGIEGYKLNEANMLLDNLKKNNILSSDIFDNNGNINKKIYDILDNINEKHESIKKAKIS